MSSPIKFNEKVSWSHLKIPLNGSFKQLFDFIDFFFLLLFYLLKVSSKVSTVVTSSILCSPRTAKHLLILWRRCNWNSWTNLGSFIVCHGKWFCFVSVCYRVGMLNNVVCALQLRLVQAWLSLIARVFRVSLKMFEIPLVLLFLICYCFKHFK